MDDVLLLPLLRRSWWVVVLAAIVAGLVGVGAASLMKATYAAEAQLLVGPINGDSNTLQAAGQLSRTYADLADSRPVVVPAAHSAGVNLSPTELQSAVSGSANEITRVVNVRVELHDATEAAALANAIGTGLITLSKGTSQQVNQTVQSVLANTEVSRLLGKQPAALQALTTRLNASLAPGQMQVVQPAVRPSSPSSPKRTLMGLLGAVAGALLAGVLLFVRETSTHTRASRGSGDPRLEDLRVPFLQEDVGREQDDPGVRSRSGS